MQRFLVTLGIITLLCKDGTASSDCSYLGKRIGNAQVSLINQCTPCYCNNGQLHCKPRARCKSHHKELKKHKVVFTRKMPNSPMVNVQPKRVDKTTPLVDRHPHHNILRDDLYHRKVRVCPYDNKLYRHGEYFRKDKCYVCRCMHRTFGHTIRCVYDDRCNEHDAGTMCRYRDKFYPLHTRFRKSRCRVCSCSRHPHCAVDKVCVEHSATSPGCIYQGTFYHDYQTLSVGCRSCQCLPQDGEGESYIKCRFGNVCEQKSQAMRWSSHAGMTSSTSSQDDASCHLGHTDYNPGEKVRVERCRYCRCDRAGGHRFWRCYTTCNSNHVPPSAPICSYRGSVFRQGTSWKNEDTCRKCTCVQAGDVFCVGDRRCRSARAGKRCVLHGNSYSIGAKLRTTYMGHCVVCRCTLNHSGNVRLACSPVHCISEHHSAVATLRCESGGRLYRIGEVFKRGSCYKCQCVRHQGQYTATKCTYVCSSGCRYGKRLVPVGHHIAISSCRQCRCVSRAGSLLFTCTTLPHCRSCVYHGHHYRPGQVFPDGMGNTCSCHGTHITCHIYQPRQRTPFCTIYGSSYSVGAHWSQDKCTTCSCFGVGGTPQIRCKKKAVCHHHHTALPHHPHTTPGGQYCLYLGHRHFIDKTFSIGNCNLCCCRSIAGDLRILCRPDPACESDHVVNSLMSRIG